MRGELFRVADFAVLCCLLGTEVPLQVHDKVSDAVREVFKPSLCLTRAAGCLAGRRGMRAALDTTYILGRGAVKDPNKPQGESIVPPMRTLAAVAAVSLPPLSEADGGLRDLASSVKGEAAIDWSDRRTRQKPLGEVVADADRLPELARQAWAGLSAGSAERPAEVDGAELLGQLLLPDVQRVGDVDGAPDPDADDGVSKDRILSLRDPEMRQGRRSTTRRFDQHKAAVVVDAVAQPGSADAAPVAPVPGCPSKDGFVVDLVTGSCTCPVGQVTHPRAPVAARTDLAGRIRRLGGLRFDGTVCDTRPLRPECTSTRASMSRTVRLRSRPRESLWNAGRISNLPRFLVSLTAVWSAPAPAPERAFRQKFQEICPCP